MSIKRIKLTLMPGVSGRSNKLNVIIRFIGRNWMPLIAAFLCTMVFACLFLINAMGYKMDEVNKYVFPAFLFALLPNIFCTAALYFFSPGSVNLGAEIVRIQKTNQGLIRDINEERISRVPIRVLDTRITNLMDTINQATSSDTWFRDSLIEAISVNKNNVIILLANPLSDFAFQRAKDQKQPKNEYMKKHLDGIFKLHAIRRDIDEVSNKMLTLKLYDTMPPPAMHLFSTHGYVTFFPAEGETDNSEALRFKLKSEFGERVTAVFQDVLGDDDTIDAEEMVYCKHKVQDNKEYPKGHEINFLYHGSSEDERMPNYLLIGDSQNNASYINGKKNIEFELAKHPHRAEIVKIDMNEQGYKYNKIVQSIRSKYHYKEQEFKHTYGERPILLEITGLPVRHYIG